MRSKTLEQEAMAGVRAKHILEDPIYRDAWEAVETGIVERWKESPILDHEGQHELRLMLHVMASVKVELERVMNTGKLASAQIEQEQSKFQKARKAFGL